jgi:hypothetical protein
MRNKDFLLTFQANGLKIMADEKGKLKMTYEKGKCVKVIGGTHKNKTVWLNAAKPETTESRVNIIVDDAKGERATWTSPRFISSDVIAVTPPSSYAHAVLQQQPKTELLVKTLTIELARCKLDAAAIDQISEYFDVQLKHAVRVQASLGLSKALYKHVDYKAVKVDGQETIVLTEEETVDELEDMHAYN